MSGVRDISGARSLWLAVLAVLLGALMTAAPARAAAAAQQNVFLEVNPTTIQAGFQVGVLASCGGDPNRATVTSDAFGEITLNPASGSELLQGSATVPTSTSAGEYQAHLRCASGATASTELFVLGMAQPTRGPKTGGGGIAAGGVGGAGGPVAVVLLTGTGVAALAAGGMLLAFWWRGRWAPCQGPQRPRFRPAPPGSRAGAKAPDLAKGTTDRRAD